MYVYLEFQLAEVLSYAYGLVEGKGWSLKALTKQGTIWALS